MKPEILLVHPPVYDFAAYDFWIKPLGLLNVAGYLRGKADFIFFDYLDRQHPFYSGLSGFDSDIWGRGRFYNEIIPNPPCLKRIPRFFQRFGLPRQLFINFLQANKPCDFVFIETSMTYWFPGVKEVIEDVRKFRPESKIVLGGNYTTICPDHAKKLGADLVIQGNGLEPLWNLLNIEPDLNEPALWESYNRIKTGILNLSDGCPFNCTYCSVPKVYGEFKPRPLEKALAELELLKKLGVENIAFYDDALLFDADNVIIPFLNEVIKRKIEVNFHTPNALNARFITEGLAKLMFEAGFKTFYIGFESTSIEWQHKTGGKVYCDELKGAIENLVQAGADKKNITVYQILGHPFGNIQSLEKSMRFVQSLGVRGMLADFSPIPGTPDGDYCIKWVNMNEPLMHNKTTFPVILLGFEEANRFKDLQRKLNRAVKISE